MDGFAIIDRKLETRLEQEILIGFNKYYTHKAEGYIILVDDIYTHLLLRDFLEVRRKPEGFFIPHQCEANLRNHIYDENILKIIKLI
ncbi:hypothetical protein KQY27_00195 [Methanobrevibacter sp. TMH8]|uniref:hypothetical protein n=1 Tax=Methanobrevibacter sp. TMH8 TaxID=2848611 RepID=UPI001CC9589B|nr:hypothetical protein [Methanobrevibacter sp. TMH8]MBZ9569978.1 hypothetical protein [Methanobrevibacter sp. TMH8]